MICSGIYEINETPEKMNECNGFKPSNRFPKSYIPPKQVRIIDLVTIIKLCDKKLRVKMNMKTTNVKMESIDEKYKNNIIFNLIISRTPHTYTTNMKEGV